MAILDAAVESEEAVENTVGKSKWAKKAPIICPIELTGGKGHKTPVSKKCTQSEASELRTATYRIAKYIFIYSKNP